MFQTFTGNAAMGPVASPNTRGPGGLTGAPGGWHPTILYMILLLLAEMFAVALLSRTLLR